MANAYFCAETLDDGMRAVIEEIQTNGHRIHPTKGPAAEITGVLLEISNPRARLSRTETRGKPFSCLGELCWYLAKSDNLGFISYYLPEYKNYADGDVIFGGYGPRLFDWKGVNQITNVTGVLEKLDSRQAVVQLFDAQDIMNEHKDVPCTCTLQFLLRGAELHLFTCMRSNDVFWGLPHDIFCFTMLQEILARALSVEVGTYKHAVGSLHLYDTHKESAKQFLAEGWQSGKMPMPPMPLGNPWPAVGSLVKAEAAIRTQGAADVSALDALDPYWADLIRMLQILRCSKDDKADEINRVRQKMSSNVYDAFIETKITQMSDPTR